MNYDKRKIRSYMDEYFSLERGEKIIRDALNLSNRVALQPLHSLYLYCFTSKRIGLKISLAK